LLESRVQDARAVRGTGPGEGGSGGRPPSLARKGPALADEPVTTLARHREVAQQHVGTLGLQRGKRRFGGPDGGHGGAHGLEDVGQSLSHVGRVVSDQYANAVEGPTIGSQ